MVCITLAVGVWVGKKTQISSISLLHKFPQLLLGKGDNCWSRKKSYVKWLAIFQGADAMVTAVNSGHVLKA